MKSLIIFLISILFSIGLKGQEARVVQGRVLNVLDSLPIENATVRFKGHQPVLTGKNGQFVLRTSNIVGELKFSHLGFQTYTYVFSENKNPTTITIFMTPAQHEIDEVVISTGYEKIPLERATGSFSIIDRKMLDLIVGFEAISQLDHLTTGVFFDRSSTHINMVGRQSDQTKLSVHGISTLRSAGSGANMPLIILDDVPFEGDINEINPNDIENITILKDAAAASIWGAKAGNGVIVVTTKRGNYGQKIQSNINYNLSIFNKPDLFAQKTLEISDIIDLEIYLFSKGHYRSKETNRAKPLLSPVIEILIKERDGFLSNEEANKQIDLLREIDLRNDLLKYSYQNAIHNQFSWNIRGGGSKHNFSLSLGYDKSSPTTVTSKDERVSIKLDQSIQLLSNLEFSSILSWMNNSIQHNSGSISFNQQTNIPYIRLADDFGNALAVPRDYRIEFVDTAGQGLLYDWKFYPLEEMKNYANKYFQNRIIINNGLNYKLSSAINIQLKYQFDWSENRTREFNSELTYFTRNKINRGTQFVNNETIHHFPVGGILSKTNGINKGSFGRFQLNYNNVFKEKHYLRGLIGMDIQSTILQNLGGFTSYGYDDNVLTYRQNIDHNFRYPVFGNLAINESIAYPIKGESYLNNRFVSYYGNLSYSLIDKYVFNGSVRKDASNLFGINSNNKWTPLWSLGFAWNVNKESFMYRIPFVDNLKFRSSFGYSGNVDQSTSAVTTIRYENNNAIFGADYWPKAAVVGVPPNESLRWEKVQNINFGIDFSLFNFLNSSIDFYRKDTKDLLQNAPLDPSAGHLNMIMNVAKTQSSGIDLTLNGDIKFGPFNWKTHFLFTYNNNVIKKSFTTYSNPRTYVNFAGISTLEGGLAYPAYSYKWAGLDSITGEPLGILNGEKSKDYRSILSNQTQLTDLIFHGSSRPLYFGGFRNEVNYQNFSFSVFLTYKLKYYFRRQSLDYSSLFDNLYGHADYYNRWKNPGDELITDVPSLIYPSNSQASQFYLYTERSIEKGDHIRIQEIRVKYGWKNKPKINVFVSGNNLGFIWRSNKKNLDPDMNSMIPMPKRYLMGIQINF